MKHLRKCFILVGGYEIDAGINSGTPTNFDFFDRSKVVTRIPSQRIGGCMSIESIETNPKAASVSVFDQHGKSLSICLRPVARIRWTSCFDKPPRVVPPPA